jgi:hypothetical protein
MKAPTIVRRVRTALREFELAEPAAPAGKSAPQFVDSTSEKR